MESQPQPPPEAGALDERLCYAAMTGDVNLLREVIRTDPHILDRVVSGMFKGKNPLNVAISSEQTGFVVELLRLERGLAELLDPDLGAPLHIASAKRNLGIVRAVLDASPAMCLARDRNGYNPLHVAAIKGRMEVLELLTGVNRDRARVKVDKDEGETILHLCVKYDQLDCLKVLVEWIRDPDFVNDVDIGGNTILHRAVSQRRHEMIQLFLSDDHAVSRLLDVNATNKSGRTALDIHYLLGGWEENTAILLSAGARRGTEVFVKDEPAWLSESRNTFMIVASLIATMAFQVGVNPPGGVWQDTSAGHLAGEAVLAHTHPKVYGVIIIANTLRFLLSLSTITLLIFTLPEPNRGYLRARAMITWWTIGLLSATYMASLRSITPWNRCHGLIITVAVMFSLWILVVSTLLMRVLMIRDNGPRERLSSSEGASQRRQAEMTPILH